MLSNYHNPLVALHDLTLSLLSEQNADKLLNAILDQAIEFTKADSGSICLLNETRKYLEIKAQRGLGFDASERYKLRVGEGVTGRCLLTGRRRNVGDTRQDPYYVEIRPDIRSELAVPLKVGSKTFGVISVDSAKLYAFTSEHEEYLELLASYAAQILTHHQALTNLRHRTEILQALLEITPLVTKNTDFSTNFQLIMSHLSEKIGIERAAVFLLEEVKDELRLIASIGYTEDEKTRARFQPGEGITGTVYQEKKFIAIADISQDHSFLNKTGRKRAEGEVTSFFAAPVYLNNEVKGVFSMEIPYTSPSFFEDYQYLVQIITSLFSQALHIRQLLEDQSRNIRQENITLKKQLSEKYRFANIIGKSPQMQALFEKMRMVADTSSSILLVGESGTGKEMIATALHQNSLRKDENLVKINCAAIPVDLLESELFGYVRGAFTGAHEDHPGKILLAHKGTLFLDEIGEMDFRLQSKLLRVLQEKEFSPLGSNKVYKVDVRIIAATNANLEELISQKKFREDLYYRLNVIRLEIPPLRERREDIPLLVRHLIQKISHETGKATYDISRKALEKLMAYDFPGNVRELENILERAIVLTGKPILDAEDIILTEPRKEILSPKGTVIGQSAATSFSLREWIIKEIHNSRAGHYYKDIIGKFEKELILIVLQNNLFNKTKTATQLGLNRLTLDRKIKAYQIAEEIRQQSAPH
ncbi:MAG: sigma 54-interacting transcriptional regulator [Leptospiraceae bacterium]|nr:sigma 54-interacting transcriptional regulator [Leptospiraceae bacterium]MDW8305875.1 sigma 54-interacting transcriptional regulator [Leptospiraceae bacterium]